ncbi:MAG TPA: methyl-accepting chemotaxis protein [Syntrophorhabdaceae bacterium]|nr:methyl-accepting chemotaxis protein [Syntrophorhabdaceae bacterium]
MKKWLCDLKLTTKLLIAPLTAVVFLLVFGCVVYTGFYQQSKALDDVVNKRFSSYQTTTDIIIKLNQVQGQVYRLQGLISEKAPEPKIRFVADKLTGTIKEVADTMQKFVGSKALSKEEQESLGGMIEFLSKYDEIAKDLTKEGAEVNVIVSLTNSISDAITEKADSIIALQKKLSKDQYAGSLKMFRLVLIISVIVFLAAVALPLFISLTMRSIILMPIQKAADIIRNLARGDLTGSVDIDSSDEIGEMVRDVNVLTETLHETIKQISTSSSDVSSAAAMLDSATEQMATGVEEAAMQVNSVATASEEMSKTTSEIAQNCVVAAKNSQDASDSANAGETIISETIDVMNRINGNVKESAQIIRELGQRSDQIGEVVGLINDVADQTNLLALNAAIEAARAGEHGRGFAVVADEVRKLAERTTQATQEIRQTIQSMQTETKKAVVSMEEGVKDVGQGAIEAQKSGDALKSILDQITKVTAEINQIAVASEEETATTNEIASSIQQISQVMQETARRIQQNAEASAKLASLSKDMDGIVGRFKL